MELLLKVDGGGYDSQGDRVFRGVSFAVAPGDMVALTGPNGAGKTTLIRCLVKILKWTSGSCEWMVSGREISYVPQKWSGDSVFPLAVNGVLALGLHSVNELRNVRDGLGITGLLGKSFSRLSLGQQKKVLLVRALERGPKLIILDEPFAGLDRDSSEYLIGVLLEQVRQGTGVLIASHESPYLIRLGARILPNLGQSPEFSDAEAGS